MFNPNPLWPLWIYASFNTAFEERLEGLDIPLFFEGATDENLRKGKRLEIDIVGPEVDCVAKECYDLEVKVRMLLTLPVTNVSGDKYEIHKLGGQCVAACKMVEVFDFGTEANPALQFCMKPDFSEARKVKYHYFGQIEPDVAILQAGIAAVFKKEQLRYP